MLENDINNVIHSSTGTADYHVSDAVVHNSPNGDVLIDETTGMRIVERGKKRHQISSPKKNISMGTIVLLLFGAVFVVVGIALVVGAFGLLFQGDGEAFFALLFTGVFMMPFGLVPGLIAIHTIKKNKMNCDVMANGIMTRLPIANIIFTNSYSNDVPGYRIEVMNPNHKKGFMHTYRSETIYSYDVEWLKEGDLMPIYVDKVDPTIFYMDLETAVFDAKYKDSMEGINHVQ